MDASSAFDAIAEVIRAVPQSGLLVATVAALVVGWIGAIMLRNEIKGGRFVRSLSSLVLIAILLTVFLQLARLDPRLDAVTEIGLPEQSIAGGETIIPMSRDGHYWIEAEVNGVPTRFLVDTGATLTAFSEQSADAAGLEPRTGGLPVMLNTANGRVTADMTTVDALSFGNIEARGLDAVIVPNLGRTNVLGMNFLSRLDGWRVKQGNLILDPGPGESG